MMLNSNERPSLAGRWRVWAAAAAGCLALAAGCGGGGSTLSSSGTPAPAPTPGFAEMASATVTVDAKTGAVAVENLKGPDGRAVFSPGAVDIGSSILSDEPGSTGRRILKLWVSNNTGEEIGSPDGLRVTLGAIENLTASPTNVSTQTDVTTIAGNGVAGSGDGAATGSVLQNATAITADEHGIYFTTSDGRVKKLANGQVMTLAQGLINPRGIVAVGGGSDQLFVSDTGRNRIMRVPTNGGVPVHVSGSTAATAGDSLGAATVARYDAPMGLALAAFRGLSAATEWRLFVADSNNNKVKVIMDPLGAPNATTFGSTDGKPQFVATGYVGNGTAVFATTDNHVVQATSIATSLSIFTTIAGTGSVGNAEGVGTAASFNSPAGITVVRNALYVADFNNGRIRQMLLQEGGSPISPGSWRVSRFAGTTKAAAVDGSGAVAAFDNLTGIAHVEGVGLVAGDTHRIRQITAPRLPLLVGNDGGSSSSSKVSVSNAEGFSAAGRPYFYTSHPASENGAPSVGPIAFVVPENVRLFQFNVTVEGALSYPGALDAQTGNGSSRVLATRVAGDGNSSFMDGIGFGARFHSIRGMHLIGNGTLYIADRGNHSIRRMTPKGEVTTVIGSPSKSSSVTAGTGVAASLSAPNAIWMNDQETEGFAVTDTFLVRLTRNGDAKQIASWTLSIVGGGIAGMVEGNGTTARFNALRDIMPISETEFLICDMVNGRVRRMTQIAADRAKPESWNYSSLSSGLAKPFNIARTLEGQIFVSAEAGAVYSLTPTGVATIYAGSISTNGYVDNTRTASRFNAGVAGLVADNAGHLYVGETGAGRIRRISANSNTVGTVVKGGAGAAEGLGSVASLGLGVLMVERMPDGDLYASDGASIWTVRRVVGP